MRHRRLVLVSIVAAAAVPAGLALAQFKKYPDPGCDNCKPGEYYQRVVDTVPPGTYVYIDDPPCSDPSVFTDKVSSQFDNKQSSGDGRVDAASGAVGAVARGIGIGGTVGQILNDYAGHNRDANKSRCSVVCGVVPNGATVSAYRISLSDKDGRMIRCRPGSPCAGWARVHHPERRGRLACVVVSNWSHNLSRKVYLDYWYTNPQDEPVEYR